MVGLGHSSLSYISIYGYTNEGKIGEILHCVELVGRFTLQLSQVSTTMLSCVVVGFQKRIMCLWSQGRETPVKCEVLNEEMYAKESRGSGVVVTPFFPILQGGRYYMEAINIEFEKKINTMILKILPPSL